MKWIMMSLVMTNPPYILEHLEENEKIEIRLNKNHV